MKVFELPLNRILFAHSLLCKLQVGRVENSCEFVVFAVVDVAANYD